MLSQESSIQISKVTEFKEFFSWTTSSTKFLSAFILLLSIIGYAWWPLAEEYIAYFNPQVSIWRQLDWLLISIFLFMSILITANANIKNDLPIIVIGLLGGLVIEAWGTQTELWTYYTNERPPLWIIPAWPIASLSIDRIYRLTKIFLVNKKSIFINYLFTFTMVGFFILMLNFISPTIKMSLSIMATLLSILTVFSIKNKNDAFIFFIAGSGLGYFLELWGTTRECWTYYNFQSPPIFAIFAHGMAAMVFWQIFNLSKVFYLKLQSRIK